MKSSGPPERRKRLTAKTPWRPERKPLRQRPAEPGSGSTLRRGTSGLTPSQLRSGDARLSRSTPVRARSKRVTDRQKARGPQIEAWAWLRWPCALCPVLRTLGLDRMPRCPGAQHGHERRKSATGSDDPVNRWPACDWSNGFVEDHPDLAVLAGLWASADASRRWRAPVYLDLVIREGHPLYARLSRRAAAQNLAPSCAWPKKETP